MASSADQEYRTVLVLMKGPDADATIDTGGLADIDGRLHF